MLFTLQQDCKHAKRRLLLVVKVVFVVFPNSAGFFCPREALLLVADVVFPYHQSGAKPKSR